MNNLEIKAFSDFAVKTIEEETDIDITKNKSRKREVVELKQLYIFLMREIAKAKLQHIGGIIKLHHSTVMTHLEVYKNNKSPLKRLENKIIEEWNEKNM